MTELVATTPGLYPLPDWAKADLGELKGRRTGDPGVASDGDVTVAYDRAREEVIADQREAGLDRIVEGQVRWLDMLAHPLTVHEAVDTGSVVRYYGGNNFYRDPRVTGDLSFSGDAARDLEAAAEGVATDRLQAVLPGPYSLSRLATDCYYGDDADFLDAIAGFLAGEVAALPEHATLFLLEPSLVVDPPGDGVDARAAAAVDEVAGASGADVVVHTSRGPLDEKAYAHLMDADVDAIGFDFVAEQERSLYNINEYGTTADIALGLVDGRTTQVESPGTVRERVDWVDERTYGGFDRIYVTANTELFYLPVPVYREKLAVLGAAAGPAGGAENAGEGADGEGAEGAEYVGEGADSDVSAREKTDSGESTREGADDDGTDRDAGVEA